MCTSQEWMKAAGGHPSQQHQLIFKSTDGGATLANTYTGPVFHGAGRGLSAISQLCFQHNGGYLAARGLGTARRLGRDSELRLFAARRLAATPATSFTFALPTVVSLLAHRSS